MRAVRCLATLLLLLLELLPGPGRAQEGTMPSAADKTAALAAAREGNRLLDAGKAEEALARFLEAHRLVGGEKLYFNLGQAHRAIPGHDIQAYVAFSTFIEGAKTASAETVAAARAERVEVRKKLALVTVTTSPAGAAISIDGLDRGLTPSVTGVPLLPGSHRVRVSKAGHVDIDEALVTIAGQDLEKSFVLLRVQPPPSLTPDPIASVVTSPNTLPHDPGAQPGNGPGGAQDLASRPSPRRWWLWALIGGAVIAGTIVAIASTRGDRGPSCGDNSKNGCFGIP